jgi:hypothetical protein
MSKNKKLKEGMPNPFAGSTGAVNRMTSGENPYKFNYSGYNGTPGAADSMFARKSSVPLNQSFSEEDDEESSSDDDLLLDEPYDIDEDSIEEYSAGGVAGYTAPLQAPKNPKKFYDKMNIYNEEKFIKLTRSKLRQIILQEIKKSLQ